MKKVSLSLLLILVMLMGTISVSAADYTVTLNNQGATIAGSTAVSATYGKAMPKITVPQRTGYTFGGYYTQVKGGGVRYYLEDGTSARGWDQENNATLYAKWTAKSYTITLNSQNATTAGTTAISATYGTALRTITVPTKVGYAFGGYYTGTGGSGVQYIGADGVCVKDWYTASAATLYAKWIPNTYTVTLNNQGAVYTGTTSVTATYGTVMPKITVPTKTGHTFGGYYTQTNGTGTRYYMADGTSARGWDKTYNTTLFAKWTANTYTVTLLSYDANVSGTTSVQATYGSPMENITVPQKSGHYFAGYYSGGNGTGTRYYDENGINIVNWNVALDRNLYALWIEGSTILFDDEDATVPGTESIVVAYNYPMQNITVPKKDGYIFDGYYLLYNGEYIRYYNADGTPAVNQWNYIDGATLYANWIRSETESTVTKNEDSYTVTTQVTNAPEAYVILAAGYNGNKLVSVVEEEEGVATLTGNISDVKVMVWDTVSNLVSYSDVEVIPASEFIVE